jgi:aspartate aminotransferase-like enzyme
MRDIVHQRTGRYAKIAAEAKSQLSATVTALEPVLNPDTIREEMKKRGYTLGGGYGIWKNRTFRIGHMGDIPVADLETMLDALGEVAKG